MQYKIFSSCILVIGLFSFRRFSSLLLLVIQLLCRLDALHVGAEFVDSLHPFVVLIRVENDAAALDEMLVNLKLVEGKKKEEKK